MNRAPAITLDELKAILKRYGCTRNKATYVVVDSDGNAIAGANNEFHAHIIRRALVNSGQLGCRVIPAS